jgi:hypothetical protein
MSASDSWIMVISLMGLAVIITDIANKIYIYHIFKKFYGATKNGRIKNQATIINDSELERKSKNRFKRSFFAS